MLYKQRLLLFCVLCVMHCFKEEICVGISVSCEAMSIVISLFRVKQSVIYFSVRIYINKIYHNDLVSVFVEKYSSRISPSQRRKNKGLGIVVRTSCCRCVTRISDDYNEEQGLFLLFYLFLPFFCTKI